MKQKKHLFFKSFFSSILLLLLFFALGLSNNVFGGKTNVKYKYNNGGRLIQSAYSTGVIIDYTYDKTGNLKQQKVTLNNRALFSLIAGQEGLSQGIRSSRLFRTVSIHISMPSEILPVS
jgi:YD repeat-containing protein